MFSEEEQNFTIRKPFSLIYNNILKVLCINAVYLFFLIPLGFCLWQYISFNALLPLIVAVPLVFILGPGVLSMYLLIGTFIKSNTANEFRRFFAIFARNIKKGMVLSAVYFFILVFSIIPMGFFIHVDTLNRRWLIISCTSVVIIVYFIYSTFFINGLLSDTSTIKDLIHNMIVDVQKNKKKAIVLGTLKFVYASILIINPFLGMAFSLIGVPTAVLIVIMYIYLFNSNEQS